MLKVFFLLVISQFSYAQEPFESFIPVNEELAESESYHEYLDTKVRNISTKILKAYNDAPEKVCQTLNVTPVEFLLDYREVLERNVQHIDCAQDSLNKIDDYYLEYTSFYNALSVPSSKEVYLDKAYSLPTQKPLPPKVVNLTFDDGPHSVNTQKILNTLDVYGIRANFFVMGKNARAYPFILREIANRGHSVGTHSMNHHNLPNMSFEKAVNEITSAINVINQILGGVDPFFRFPYGARTPALRSYLAQNNISDFFWTVDTLDWKYKNPSALLTYALDQTRKSGRGIVLFHDIQPQTAAILPAYLEALTSEGYSTVVYLPQ